jgi:hypothetical protein
LLALTLPFSLRSYEIISEEALDPKATYVYASHPHGVFPMCARGTPALASPACLACCARRRAALRPCAALPQQAARAHASIE